METWIWGVSMLTQAEKNPAASIGYLGTQRATSLQADLFMGPAQELRQDSESA